jgi:hypothetical protein
MSHMSLLETHARYSIAISILNSLRHWLIGREGGSLRKEDRDIFLESLEISESPTLSDKMVLYSFHGFGSHQHSAAIELSEAINKVLEQFDESVRGAYLDALRRALEVEAPGDLNETEKGQAIAFVTRAMYVIDSQEDTGTQNIFAPRDL